VEIKCDEGVFGKEGRGRPKDPSPDHPPTPEVSVQEYVAKLPF